MHLPSLSPTQFLPPPLPPSFADTSALALEGDASSDISIRLFEARHRSVGCIESERDSHRTGTAPSAAPTHSSLLFTNFITIIFVLPPSQTSACTQPRTPSRQKQGSPHPLMHGSVSLSIPPNTSIVHELFDVELSATPTYFDADTHHNHSPFPFLLLLSMPRPACISSGDPTLRITFRR